MIGRVRTFVDNLHYARSHDNFCTLCTRLVGNVNSRPRALFWRTFQDRIQFGVQAADAVAVDHQAALVEAVGQAGRAPIIASALDALVLDDHGADIEPRTSATAGNLEGDV